MNSVIRRNIATLQQICHTHDARWITRKRKLDTWTITSFLLSAFLQPHAIATRIAMDNLIHKQTWDFSHVAIHKARRRLPPNIFEDFTRELQASTAPTSRSRGAAPPPRILAVDGSKIRLPPSFAGHGFQFCSNARTNPSALLSCMLDVSSGKIADIRVSPSHNERSAALFHTPHVRPTDVMVFDRGYFSHDLAHRLQSHGIRFVFRLKETPNRAIRTFLANRRTHDGPLVLKRGQEPNDTVVRARVVQYHAKGTRFLMLVSPGITAAQAREWYRRRWDVEETFKTLKCNLLAGQIRERSPELLTQSLWLRVLAHEMLRSEKLQGKTIVVPRAASARGDPPPSPSRPPVPRKPNGRFCVALLVVALRGVEIRHVAVPWVENPPGRSFARRAPPQLSTARTRR